MCCSLSWSHLYIHCVLQSLLVSSIHTLCVAVSLGLIYTYTVCCSLSWSLLYIHCVLQSLLVSSIHTLCVAVSLGLIYTYTVCCSLSWSHLLCVIVSLGLIYTYTVCCWSHLYIVTSLSYTLYCVLLSLIYSRTSLLQSRLYMY